MSSDTPQWITDAVQDARQLLGIDDGWHITIDMVDEPSGDRSYNGATTYSSVYLNAKIELAKDLENNAEGQRVVMHEVFHVALAQMYLAAGYTFNRLPKKQRKMARLIYNDAEEQFIQRATRAMQREIRPYKSDNGNGNENNVPGEA